MIKLLKVTREERDAIDRHKARHKIKTDAKAVRSLILLAAVVDIIQEREQQKRGGD